MRRQNLFLRIFLITFATDYAVKEVKTARSRDFGCVIVVNMYGEDKNKQFLEVELSCLRAH